MSPLDINNISMEDIEGKLPPNEAKKALRQGTLKLEDDVEPTPVLEDKHLVFVYGSLMKGFGNHRLLSNSNFLGNYATKKRYRMVSLGGFPAVLKGVRPLEDLPSIKTMENSLYKPIQGELYEVDSKVFKSLDGLEGYPSFYTRQEVELKQFLDKAWMYMFPKNEDRYPNCALNIDGNYSWYAEIQRKNAEKFLKIQSKK